MSNTTNNRTDRANKTNRRATRSILAGALSILSVATFIGFDSPASADAGVVASLLPLAPDSFSTGEEGDDGLVPFDPSILVVVPLPGFPIPEIDDFEICTEDCGPDPVDPIDDFETCTEDCGPDPVDPIDDFEICTEDCGPDTPDDGDPEVPEEDGTPEEDGEPDPEGPSIDEPVPGNPDFTG